MFELIAAPFHFLTFKKGGEGGRAMKCQWGGNSLNKLLASFCLSKRILRISICRYIYLFILYYLLRREGRFKTRLSLHFSGGAILAASQIQLLATASLSYKIRIWYESKWSFYCYRTTSLSTPEFQLLSTSSSLSIRQNHRVEHFKIK